jgi:hypothetical protein
MQKSLFFGNLFIEVGVVCSVRRFISFPIPLFLDFDHVSPTVFYTLCIAEKEKDRISCAAWSFN